MKNFFFPLLLIIFLVFPDISYAYIGPGLALGGLSIVIVVILLVAILALIYYPIKKMIKNIKIKKKK